MRAPASMRSSKTTREHESSSRAGTNATERRTHFRSTLVERHGRPQAFGRAARLHRPSPVPHADALDPSPCFDLAPMAWQPTNMNVRLTYRIAYSTDWSAHSHPSVKTPHLPCPIPLRRRLEINISKYSYYLLSCSRRIDTTQYIGLSNVAYRALANHESRPWGMAHSAVLRTRRAEGIMRIEYASATCGSPSI